MSNTNENTAGTQKGSTWARQGPSTIYLNSASSKVNKMSRLNYIRYIRINNGRLCDYLHIISTDHVETQLDCLHPFVRAVDPFTGFRKDHIDCLIVALKNTLKRENSSA